MDKKTEENLNELSKDLMYLEDPHPDYELTVSTIKFIFNKIKEFFNKK